MEQQPIRPFAALIVGGLLLVGNEYAAEHYRTLHASAYVLGIGCLLAGAVELIGRLFMRASRSQRRPDDRHAGAVRARRRGRRRAQPAAHLIRWLSTLAKCSRTAKTIRPPSAFIDLR